MTNYFIPPAELMPMTKARSVDINALSAAVGAAFDKVPDQLELLGGNLNYAVDTGAPNAIVIALPAELTALADGMQFRVKLKNTITGAATATLGELGTFPLRRPDLTAIQGELVVNQVVEMTYVGGTLQASRVILPGVAGPGLPLAGGTLTGPVNEALSPSVAAAAALDLQNIGGNFVHITGAGVNIATIALGAGAHRTVVFDGVNTLVHSGALLLPGLANIITAAGDRMSLRGDANGALVVAYQRANGSPVTLPLLPGDLLYSARALTAPDYLKADGSTYTKAAYPGLAAVLGSIPNSFNAWQSRNNGGTPNGVTAAIVNGGLMVMASNNGYFYSSTDGLTWTNKGTIGTQVYGVAFGAGLYVAVATTGRVYTSPDLMTWTQRTSNTASNLNAVTFANGVFVAIGAGATIIVSPDGINWTVRASAIASFSGNGITYAAGMFVAVGAPATAGAAAIQTSPDGVTWTSRLNGGTSTLYAVTFGNGLFVAVGGDVQSAAGTTTKILTSPDGITWTSRTVTAGYDCNAAVWTGTHFIVGTKAGNNISSTDGITWTMSAAISPNTCAFLLLAGYVYAFGGVATNAIVRRVLGATFTTATAWTLIEMSLISGSIPNASFANGVFILGAGGANSLVLLTSTDGLQWTNRTTPSGSYGLDSAFGAGQYVVVGGAGIISSPDLINWTSRLGVAMNNVTFANGLFVATGGTGKLYTSPDGINWTVRTAPSGTLGKAAYGNGVWIGVVKNGGFFTSIDGITWSASVVPRPGFGASTIAFGNGIFVMVGFDTAGWFSLTSSDGQTWTENLISNSTSGTAVEMAFGSGIFHAIGTAAGFMATSFDGIAWILRAGATAQQNTVAIGAGQIVCGATTGITLTNALFSYDTATAFCVPAMPPRLAAIPYYKA